MYAPLARTWAKKRISLNEKPGLSSKTLRDRVPDWLMERNHFERSARASSKRAVKKIAKTVEVTARTYRKHLINTNSTTAPPASGVNSEQVSSATETPSLGGKNSQPPDWFCKI
jgi:hypothetical protein